MLRSCLIQGLKVLAPCLLFSVPRALSPTPHPIASPFPNGFQHVPSYCFPLTSISTFFPLTFQMYY